MTGCNTLQHRCAGSSRRPGFQWSNALLGRFHTNPSDTMNTQNITSMKPREMWSAKCQPFCLSLNVLTPSCYRRCDTLCWPSDRAWARLLARCTLLHKTRVLCSATGACPHSVCHVRYHTCAVPVHRSMPSTSHLIRGHQVCAVSYLLSVICSNISVNALLAVNPAMDSVWPALCTYVCFASGSSSQHCHVTGDASNFTTNILLHLLIVVGIQGDATNADPLCS